MTAKELKRLSRRDLLEMLLEQSKQVQQLQQQLADAQAELDSRKLQLNKAGSIAEAALQVNGVFEAAQAAGQQYLENIKNLSGRQEEVCRQMEQECDAQIERRRQEAEQECSQMIERCKQETERVQQEMLAKTKKQCVEILERVKAQARTAQQ